MPTDFQRALAFTLRYEGGYSNHAADRGGATMRGVTQNTFNTYLHANKKPFRDVRTITQAELEDIYKTRYWDVVTTGRVWPLNAVMFDVAVNSGPGTAEWMLDQVRNLVSAIDPARQKKLALAMCDERERFYKTIVRNRPSQIVFLRGWLARATALRQFIGGA